MTDKEKITAILKAYTKKHNISASSVILEEYAEELLANGVIVPPCKIGDYVRFKGLTTLWQVDAIHYYREGLPQITVTKGKISYTVTNDGMFEVFTKEKAEAKLKELRK